MGRWMLKKASCNARKYIIDHTVWCMLPDIHTSIFIRWRHEVLARDSCSKAEGFSFVALHLKQLFHVKKHILIRMIAGKDTSWQPLQSSSIIPKKYVKAFCLRNWKVFLSWQDLLHRGNLLCRGSLLYFSSVSCLGNRTHDLAVPLMGGSSSLVKDNIATKGGPLVISWFISPNNYIYKYHKP